MLGRDGIDQWGDLLSDEGDRLHQLVVREAGTIHLEGEALDAAEGRTMAQNLLGDVGGAADHQGAGGAVLGIEAGSIDGGPTALFADPGEGFGVTRVILINRLGATRCHIAQRMDAHAEALGGVTGLGASLAIEVDERAEAVGFAADNCHH